MKKCAVAVLLLTLAIAPAAFGCDPHPGGLTGALTVSVRNCFTTNYTAKDMVAACSDLRTLIAPYLTSKTSQGTTFTYTNDLNDANFIIDVYTTSANPNDDNAAIQFALKTYGLGRTADGHTLFTVYGNSSADTDSVTSALDMFATFINQGWNCDQCAPACLRK